MEKKDKYIQLRLSEEEKALWLKGLKACNYTTMAQFIRKTITDFVENKLKEV